MSDDAGGRIFFSTRGRRLVVDDEITLTSVGVDIGSSTSHLVFSQITLERLDARYVVSDRKVLYQSDILLTPYLDDQTIDDRRLRRFVDEQYERSGLSPSSIDTGALVLTGVAVRRANARSIADVFAKEAGKLVAVSAGDSLETIMSAFGSGAAARSIRESRTIVNVDIGGGTSKIAVCQDGQVIDRTAVDIGARIVAFDDNRRIERIEEAGVWFARQAGLDLQIGAILSDADAKKMAADMSRRLLAVMEGHAQGAGADNLLRLDPLGRHDLKAVTLSGGVAEFAYGEATSEFGDLGPYLARAFVDLLTREGYEIVRSDEGIRATVLGAAQYTAQVSGGTIFVSPMELLPLRNVPVIAPQLALDGKELDSDAIRSAILESLRYMELDQGDEPVAVFVRWRGSATFARLDAFSRGLVSAIAAGAPQRPIVLIGDTDVGGLIGIHIKHELMHKGPIASLDGLDLKPLDYIDVGEMLESSGATPVVIKSLVFPADARLGKPAQAPA